MIIVTINIIIIIIFIIQHTGANYAQTTHKELIYELEYFRLQHRGQQTHVHRQQTGHHGKSKSLRKDSEIIINWLCTVNTCLCACALPFSAVCCSLRPVVSPTSCADTCVYPCSCPTWLFRATLSAKRGTSWLWNATNGSEALRWESMHWFQRIVPITWACTPSCALTSLSQFTYPPKQTVPYEHHWPIQCTDYSIKKLWKNMFHKTPLTFLLLAWHFPTRKWPE